MSQASTRLLGLSVPVSECLDPVKWKERYAFGILLGAMRRPSFRERISGCDDDEDVRAKLASLIAGIDASVIRWHLRAALSELELKLGVPMGIEIVKGLPVDTGLVQGSDYDRAIPRLPYTRGEVGRFFRIDLAPNVISVERVRGYYFGQRVWDMSDNMERVRLEWPKPGVLHIMPFDLQGLIVTQNDMGGGQYGVWQTINLHVSPVPDFWSVDYTVGPVSRDGQVGHIEVALANWVYCAAGIMLLSIGGLARSNGLTNTSLSMDGVSRSVGLSASGINGLYGALEKTFKDAMDRIDWKHLRAIKRGARIFMYSY